MFWRAVKKLREEGIDCICNDNNGYTMTDHGWQYTVHEPSLQVPDKLKGRRDVGLWGRSLHAELHGKASHDALVEADPESRPFVLTRSATAGTMRYACEDGNSIDSFSNKR